MLRWALIFAVIALIAGLLGFYSLAGTAALIARVLLLVLQSGRTEKPAVVT